MKKNILIFPSGAENSIGIYDSLKYNLHFELFGATSKHDHSEYLYDDDHLSIGDYNIYSDNFFKNFNYILSKFKIDFIIPTHDEIILFLMNNENKINATIIASPKETCEIASSKLKTFDRLKGKDYISKIYKLEEDIDFPVFCKPDIGAGSKGVFLAFNKKEIVDKIKNTKYIIMENLPGEELTIDCFTDRNGKLKFVGPRSRERIVTGVSFRSSNVKLTDELQHIADDLNNTFKFRGLWFFQVKKDSLGKYKLMEICVRTAGTMALYRQLGINYPLLSLFDFMGYDIDVIKNNFEIQLDRYYKCCYKTNLKYNHVYLDFDDTLIINNKVNTEMIKLLYQWINDGKKIHLITKHSTDIYADIKKYKIDVNIFCEIISINDVEYKSNYINKKDSIFVDNYFPERKKVFIEKNIPVFDVDAAECLIR